jgi:TAP-like protein
LKQQPSDLSVVRQPALVANGDHDRMVPTKNTVDLDRRLPNSHLVIYPDAAHGGIFPDAPWWSEVLELVTLPVPEPDIGEILVGVHAADVNPVDAMNRESGLLAVREPQHAEHLVAGRISRQSAKTGPGKVVLTFPAS